MLEKERVVLKRTTACTLVESYLPCSGRITLWSAQECFVFHGIAQNIEAECSEFFVIAADHVLSIVVSQDLF